MSDQPSDEMRAAVADYLRILEDMSHPDGYHNGVRDDDLDRACDRIVTLAVQMCGLGDPRK